MSVCMAAVVSCDSTFQKPLDPFTLLRYDKRTPEDQPATQNNEKSVSVEFDEYPVSAYDLRSHNTTALTRRY